MSDVNQDLITAQRILERDYFNFGNSCYHDTSAIYKVSNEMISAIPYCEALKNREKVLSVIASGDQILNSILAGSTIIDGFDVSVFPKYFLQLKMAAISTLTRDEFLQFFIEPIDYKNIFSYDFYEKIKNNLSEDARAFWDGLFDYYEGYDIYHSTLFSSELYTTNSQLKMNPFLKEDNYSILKSNLGKIKIRFFDGNIFKIVDSLKDGYDLINLSSIVYYNNSSFSQYVDFLLNLPLNERGVAITYLYDVFGRSKQFSEVLFNQSNLSIEPFPFLEQERCDGLLTYQKKK